MNVFRNIVISVVIGTLYYYMMEYSLPIGSNCSFIATPWTDVFAFIWGVIVIYKSINYNDDLLFILAATLIVEHIWQLLPKYTLFKPKNKRK